MIVSQAETRGERKERDSPRKAVAVLCATHVYTLDGTPTRGKSNPSVVNGVVTIHSHSDESRETPIGALEIITTVTRGRVDHRGKSTFDHHERRQRGDRSAR